AGHEDPGDERGERTVEHTVGEPRGADVGHRATEHDGPADEVEEEEKVVDDCHGVSVGERGVLAPCRRARPVPSPPARPHLPPGRAGRAAGRGGRPGGRGTGLEPGGMLDRAAPHGLREAVARGDAPATRQLLDRIPVDDPEVLDVLARAAADGGVGARLATELLVERLDASGVVRRFVRAALLDEAAVDDVTQDALISVAGSVHSFAGEAKVTTWVHRIVRHRVVDHLRRQRATSPLPPDDLAPAERMSSLIATRAT